MHAKYVSKSTNTLAQIISDIALLLSGSPIADLSSSCDKINTTLVSTIAPGWTLHDAAAPGSGRVLSAPDIDGLTVKYARLFAVNATTMDLFISETWDAATHVGTNVVPTAMQISVALNSVNTFWIFATPRMLFISSTTPAQNMCVLEYSREAKYLQGSTYPCFAVGTLSKFIPNVSSSVLNAPRIKALTTNGDLLAAAATVFPGTIGQKWLNLGGQPCGSPQGVLRDQNDSQYQELRPIWIVGDTSNFAPILGRLFDVQEASGSIGNMFDTFFDGTDTYMCFKNSNSSVLFKVA